MPHPLKKSVIEIEVNYEPSEHEEYMNPKQLMYFKNKLLRWKEELLTASRDTLINLKEANQKEADPADSALHETETTLELRTRERQYKLLDKIEAAINKIDDTMSNPEKLGYGYCEETGEHIGIKRLIARPIATLSIEAQEKHESQEKQQVLIEK